MECALENAPITTVPDFGPVTSTSVCSGAVELARFSEDTCMTGSGWMKSSGADQIPIGDNSPTDLPLRLRS